MQAANSPSSFEVTTDGVGVVGHAGAALLRELADRLGLTRGLGWGGPQAAAGIRRARAAGSGGDAGRWRRLPQRPGRFAGSAGAIRPGGDPEVELLIVDADATLVLSHSDHKQGAAGTYKHTFGFAPLLAYLDRGPAPGEPLAGILRPGNAARGAASDLVELVDLALAQLAAASHTLPVLVRSDSAGASTQFAWHLRDRGVGFSLGMQVDAHVREAILVQPEHAWTPAVEPDGQVRHGAEVSELTGWVDLGNWPPATRMLCRREDAHPGCASPTTPPRPRGCGTCRSTCCATTPSSSSWSWPPRTSRAGQALLLDGGLAVAEPKTLRYRLLHVAARIVRHGRRTIRRLQRSWPWAAELARAFTRLRAIPLRC